MEIGSFEAKTHWAELLRRAEAGERVVITRRGRPVARLIPFRESDEQEDAAVFRALKDFRARTSPVPLKELLESRHVGHDY